MSPPSATWCHGISPAGPSRCDRYSVSGDRDRDVEPTLGPALGDQDRPVDGRDGMGDGEPQADALLRIEALLGAGERFEQGADRLLGDVRPAVGDSEQRGSVVLAGVGAKPAVWGVVAGR